MNDTIYTLAKQNVQPRLESLQGDALAAVEGISPMNEPGSISDRKNLANVNGGKYQMRSQVGETCSVTGWSSDDQKPFRSPEWHSATCMQLLGFRG